MTVATSQPVKLAIHGGPKTVEALERLRWLAGMGIDTVVGSVAGVEQGAPLEWVARHVVPAAAEIESRP